jgi:RNA polymerase sigma-70 factor (ECF subfamily)
LTAENPVERIDDALGSISMAFMVLLEKLSPVERAVFLLREVFEYSYAEIAEIVGKEEAACRQSFRRAKLHITENRPRFESTPDENARITEHFLEAITEGNLDGLMALLADDVTVWSDGGGKVTAARHPVHGRELVARFLLGLRKFAPNGFAAQVTEVNGALGVIIRMNGVVASVGTFEIDAGRVRQIHFVVNPDKLARLQTQ